MPMPKTVKDHPLGKAPEPKPVRVITINDNEEVRVSEDSQIRFSMLDARPINSSAFNCSGCQMATVHHLAEVITVDCLGELDNQIKRIAVCTNCAKVSLK